MKGASDARKRVTTQMSEEELPVKKANKGFNMSITEEDSSVELNQGADD